MKELPKGGESGCILVGESKKAYIYIFSAFGNFCWLKIPPTIFIKGVYLNKSPNAIFEKNN